MVTDSKREMKVIKKDIEETRKGVESIKDAAMDTATNYDTCASWQPPPSLGANSVYLVHLSYAAAARNAPSQHASAIAKGNNCECQIILTFKSDGRDNAKAHLLLKELVAKGNIMLELVEKEGVPVPKGVAFVHVTTTRSGTLIFQVNSKGAVDWLKQKDNLANFMARFRDANGAVVCARLFYVLVKFVPVNFNPNNNLSKNLIKMNNNLPTDAIVHARYIKAPERRSLNQKTAHIIMGFST